VLVEDRQVSFHEGIWDAFDVSLEQYKGKRVNVRVEVTKNGGEQYPVNKTLAGFLPYVYNTFGGIFRPVEIVDANNPLEHPVPKSAYSVKGKNIFYQGEPFYMRGILHWGWYPEFGHAHPSDEAIVKEIEYCKSLGFNTIKFCLWLPPHSYLTALEKAGMHAWIELPLWLPSSEMFANRRLDSELERMVRQYAHHKCIAAWTVGCELSNAPREWRELWVKKVRALTGCPLVKDNSGGAEMYGGDPVEFGTFEDFHPYGDAHMLPAIFDTLEQGPRPEQPILMGETNDHDVHRDLAQVAELMPFWASGLPELNDKGVRWQYDIPGFLRTNRFANQPDESGHADLMQRSLEKSIFIRKYVTESLRARSNVVGYVLTGLRDTPISSSGILTDWGRSRYHECDFATWNAPNVLFLIPSREPSWIRGGNRPGFRDIFNYPTGRTVAIRVGVSSEEAIAGALIWHLRSADGVMLHDGVESNLEVDPLTGTQVAEIPLNLSDPGTYTFDCAFGAARNKWTFHFHQNYDFSGTQLAWKDDRCEGVTFGNSGVTIAFGWREELRSRIRLGEPMVVVLDSEGSVPMPYWRENIVTEPEDWERMVAIAPDAALDPAWLAEIGEAKWIQTRVDTRTYAEHPYIAKMGSTVFTTYRIFGGLGMQPHTLKTNIAGQARLKELVYLCQVSNEAFAELS
jgi:hypothetical protein